MALTDDATRRRMAVEWVDCDECDDLIESFCTGHRAAEERIERAFKVTWSWWRDDEAWTAEAFLDTLRAVLREGEDG